MAKTATVKASKKIWLSYKCWGKSQTINQATNIGIQYKLGKLAWVQYPYNKNRINPKSTVLERQKTLAFIKKK